MLIMPIMLITDLLHHRFIIKFVGKTTQALPQSQTIGLHGVPRGIVGSGTLKLHVLP